MEYGKMLAILGSPGSGKTTAAVKLACALAAQKKNVIVVHCDVADRAGGYAGKYFKSLHPGGQKRVLGAAWIPRRGKSDALPESDA